MAADAPKPPAEESQPPRQRGGRWLELIALLLMSGASLASSWSSYQATRWSGVQSRSNAAAGGFSSKANRATGEALSQQIVDVQMFMRWLEADSRGDAEREQLYQDQFRSEFRPAFDAWLDARNRRLKDRPETPFDGPAYRLAASVKADELDRKAGESGAAGRNANHQAEAYVQSAVIFALVLFLTGMSQSFKNSRLRVWLVAAAGLAGLYGLYDLLSYPVQ
jgi:hypothetical protein